MGRIESLGLWLMGLKKVEIDSNDNIRLTKEQFELIGTNLVKWFVNTWIMTFGIFAVIGVYLLLG